MHYSNTCLEKIGTCIPETAFQALYLLQKPCIVLCTVVKDQGEKMCCYALKWFIRILKRPNLHHLQPIEKQMTASKMYGIFKSIHLHHFALLANATCAGEPQL